MANIIHNQKNRTQHMRSDSEFLREMRELAKFRYLKNLETKQPTDAEMTRLLRRTNAWKQSLIELRTKPRRENS